LVNGEFVFISPIGGYFKGDYEIVAQDPADKMVEIKTTDKIPGYTKYFHRRFKGKLSEDDQKFNGDNLSSYPKTMPVSLEYIDNSQAPSSDVIERVLEISYKKLGEAETAMVNNFNNLEEARENAKFETKRHTAEIKELKLQIEKLQTQIEQLRAQLKEKEQDISTPKSTNNE